MPKGGTQGEPDSGLEAEAFQVIPARHDHSPPAAGIIAVRPSERNPSFAESTAASAGLRNGLFFAQDGAVAGEGEGREMRRQMTR